MIDYKDFQIDDYLTIYKDGAVIFDHFTTRCHSIEQAQNLIDQSLAMKAIQDAPQVRKKISGTCELENGAADRQRREDRIEDYYLSEHNNLNEQL